MKNIQVVGRGGKEVIIVELINWEVKEKIMKEKKKLGGGRVYIDHDMSQEERDVQRKLRERARSEREKGKSVKVGYRKLNIDGKLYIWNEEAREVREKKNF